MRKISTTIKWNGVRGHYLGGHPLFHKHLSPKTEDEVELSSCGSLNLNFDKLLAGRENFLKKQEGEFLAKADQAFVVDRRYNLHYSAPLTVKEV